MMVIQLLEQYRPCLFKKHFVVLKLLLSLTVLEHKKLCSEAEKLVFLRGLEDIEHSVAEVKTPTSSKGCFKCIHSPAQLDTPSYLL